MFEEKVYEFLDEIVKVAPMFKKNFIESLGFIKEGQLSNHQYFCLSIIAMQEPVSMSILAEGLNVSKQQLTRVVDDLVALGLIERCVDPNDRRIILAKLSRKGEKYIAKLKATAKERTASLLKIVSAEEFEEAIRCLKNLSDFYEKTKNIESEE
ncbi:MAG: MarR family transcriptional regulator [Clostridiales bacterium]|jgi:DNA-binding MarR family transcriptional regulator|nr:MarR family transcriptional regulator [Clostridiales bacterium]